MNRLIILATAVALGACAAVGPTAYGPADSKGFGFDESRIESDRYRITYRGSGGMLPEQVEDYAMLRAGEVTLQNGYDWFRVIGRDVTRDQRGGVTLGAGVGTGSYRRRSSVGVGVGGNFGKIGARDFFTVRLEVLMGAGDAPDEDKTYDALSIVSSISPPPAE